MPYEPPQTTQSGVTWSLTCRYGTVSAVQVDLTIVIGDSATETDADAALQKLANLFASDSQFSQITAQKSYASSETQAMQPSV